MLRKQIQLTADDDLDLSTGNLVVLGGADALAQRIRTRLQTFLGEVFTNLSIGVPYFQSIFQDKNPKVSVLNAGFVDPVVSLDGVDKVLSVDYDLDGATRALSVTMRVQGEDETVVDQTIVAGV